MAMRRKQRCIRSRVAGAAAETASAMLLLHATLSLRIHHANR